MKVINLSFDSTMVALAGNPFGKNQFENQVKNMIKPEDDSFTIKFPDQITYITSSFIQGFFDYWLRTMGVEEIKKKVKIEAGNERIINYILENLR